MIKLSYKNSTIYFIACLMLVNCTNKNEPLVRLPDYEYPLDSLREGKVFVYKKNRTNELAFLEQWVMEENGSDFIVAEWYDTRQKLSASKIKVTPDAMEEVASYLYYYPDSLSSEYDKIKGKIVESRNTDDGKAYKGYVTAVDTDAGYIQGSVTTRQVFQKEDKFRFQGQDLDALVFASETTSKGWFKFIPFISNKTVYKGNSYYARGLGLVRYGMNTETEKSEWMLVEIRKMNR